MKKKVSIFSISLLVIGGLTLVVPFSQLRTTLGPVTAKLTNKTIESLGGGINNTNSMSIAGFVSTSLQSNPTLILNGSSENVTTDNGEGIYSRASQTETNTNGQQPIASDVTYLQNTTRSISSISNASTRANNNLSANSTSNTNRAAGVSSKKNQAIAMSVSSSNSNTASSVRQMVGGAPPPSEDEVIGTLPIGDGYIFMLILASITGLIKLRKPAF